MALKVNKLYTYKHSKGTAMGKHAPRWDSNRSTYKDCRGIVGMPRLGRKMYASKHSTTVIPTQIPRDKSSPIAQNGIKAGLLEFARYAVNTSPPGLLMGRQSCRNFLVKTWICS